LRPLSTDGAAPGAAGAAFLPDPDVLASIVTTIVIVRIVFPEKAVRRRRN
jgi:hypothetical protein